MEWINHLALPLLFASANAWTRAVGRLPREGLQH